MNIQETRLARAFTVCIDSRRYKTGISGFRRSQASSYIRANVENWDGLLNADVFN